MSPAVLERYLAVEQFRALAACLGLRRDRRKGFGGDSRHLRGQRQRRSGHREAVAVLVERHLGTRVELPVRMARARQRKGQRHGETGDGRSVVEGKSVSVRVDLGGRRIIKNKNANRMTKQEKTRTETKKS